MFSNAQYVIAYIFCSVALNFGKFFWNTNYYKGSSCGVYSVTPQNIGSRKYKISYASAPVKVVPRKITADNLKVTGDDKPYDGTNKASGTITVASGLYGNDQIKVKYGDARFSDEKIGKDKTITFTKLSLCGDKSSNYQLTADSITAKASITKAQAIVWAGGGTSHIYDGESKAITALSIPTCDKKVEYYTLDEEGEILEKEDEPTNIGEYMYVISLIDESAERYEIKGALTYGEEELIGKKYSELNASNIGIMKIKDEDDEDMDFEESIHRQTYGDADFTNALNNVPEGAEVSYELIVGDDCISIDSTTGKVKIIEPGLALISATASKEGSEDEIAFCGICIDKKKAVVTPKAGQSKKYGEEDPEFTYEVEGLINSDELKGSLGRVEGEDIGSYQYTLGSLSSECYQLEIDGTKASFEIKGGNHEAVETEPNLNLTAKSNSKGITANWNKVNDASGYMIYATYYGKKYGKPVKCLSKSKTSYTIKKLKGKKISNTKNVKLYVVAYKKNGKKKQVLCKSLTSHVTGYKNRKYTNAKAISINSDTIVLSPGQSRTINPSTIKINSKKKLLGASNMKHYRYRSSACNVATVDGNGNIYAVGQGACYIYVYAQNGVWERVKVTVG